MTARQPRPSREAGRSRQRRRGPRATNEERTLHALLEQLELRLPLLQALLRCVARGRCARLRSGLLELPPEVLQLLPCLRDDRSALLAVLLLLVLRQRARRELLRGGLSGRGNRSTKEVGSRGVLARALRMFAIIEPRRKASSSSSAAAGGAVWCLLPAAAPPFGAGGGACGIHSLQNPTGTPRRERVPTNRAALDDGKRERTCWRNTPACASSWSPQAPSPPRSQTCHRDC